MRKLRSSAGSVQDTSAALPEGRLTRQSIPLRNFAMALSLRRMSCWGSPRCRISECPCPLWRAALSADSAVILCVRTANWLLTGNTSTSATVAGRNSIGKIIPRRSSSFPIGHEEQRRSLFLKAVKLLPPVALCTSILCLIYYLCIVRSVYSA